MTPVVEADRSGRRRTGRHGAAEPVRQKWQKRYPAIAKLWRTPWSEFVPFLAFPPDVRRVIYTTNLTESMSAGLRNVTRNRGQFPSEQVVFKVP